MANPFDMVINGEHERHKGDTMRSIRSRRDGEFQVSFTVNRLMMERGLYFAVIIILMILVFVKPLCNDCETTTIKESEIAAKGKLEGVTGAAVLSKEDEVEEETEVKVISKVEEKEEEEEEEEVKIVEEEEEEEEEEDLPFKGNFDFIIEDINYYKCQDLNDDCEDDEKPVKMKSLSFKMNNRWKTFTPKIEVYWYDRESNEVLQDKKRGLKLCGVVKKGSTAEYTIDEWDSTFFDPQNNAETIEIRLYDKDTDLLLDKINTIIS